jgi:rod shape-determining protein MreB
MARNIYGLDLGSYELKVYDKKLDTIWKEKTAIAIADNHEIFAVGDQAYEMYEKTPPNIQVMFPMKEGVISRFNDMQYLLQNLLKKERHFARGSEYVIAVPTDVTEVEKKAFFDLVIHSTARAKEVNMLSVALRMLSA